MFLKLRWESFERTSKVICSAVPRWVCSPLFFFFFLFFWGQRRKGEEEEMLQPVGLNNRLWGCQGISGCALVKVLQPPCQAGPPRAVPTPWAWRQGAGQHRPGCKGKKIKI